MMPGQRWLTGLLSLVLTAVIAPGQEKTGTIHGVVRFTGTVPPAKFLATGDGGMIEHHDLVVDPKSRGLRWVIATLEDAPALAKLADEKPVVIDQKDMLFIPRVVAVQEGRPVRFDNSDQFNHNVNVISAVKENEINLFVTAREPVTKVFVAEKHPLKVGCTVHPSMTAWIHVSRHPWSAVSDERGAFKIRDVPPGKYTLFLRHPDTGLQERQRIEVRPGDAARVQVEWKEASPRREPKK